MGRATEQALVPARGSSSASAFNPDDDAAPRVAERRGFRPQFPYLVAKGRQLADGPGHPRLRSGIAVAAPNRGFGRAPGLQPTRARLILSANRSKTSTLRRDAL